jgi:hypothetical protein
MNSDDNALSIYKAAGAASQTVLGIRDRKNQKEYDAFISTVPDWFENEMLIYDRSNPFNFQGNPDDPAELDKYAHEYQKKKEYFIYEKFAKKFGSNANIAEYNAAMKRLQAQAIEGARGKTENIKDAWRISRENVSLDSDIKGYLAAGWNPEQTLNAVKNRIELSGTRRSLSP